MRAQMYAARTVGRLQHWSEPGVPRHIRSHMAHQATQEGQGEQPVGEPVGGPGDVSAEGAAGTAVDAYRRELDAMRLMYGEWLQRKDDALAELAGEKKVLVQQLEASVEQVGEERRRARQQWSGQVKQTERVIALLRQNNLALKQQADTGLDELQILVLKTFADKKKAVQEKLKQFVDPPRPKTTPARRFTMGKALLLFAGRPS